MGYSISHMHTVDLIKIVFLWPFSLAYLAATAMRKAAYRSGAIKSRKASVPVISVGNLAAGGTGKTPFCIMLAEELHAMGKRPAILSRGYKRIAPRGSKVTVVSDWGNILTGPEEAGDEPFLMARRLSGKAIVLVGKDRYAASHSAAKAGADVIILDDGFQHWRLQRNLDIVLLDGRKPLDNGWLLPAGMLRETPSALKKAGIVIFTRCQGNSADRREGIAAKSLDPAASVFCCDHKPAGLRPLGCRPGRTDEKPKAKSRLLLFSGIARPESFEDSARAMDFLIQRHLTFGDHHYYSRSDLERIGRMAETCDAIVTTEKDAVKLPIDWAAPKPVFALEIAMRFHHENDREKMFETIRNNI